MHIRFWGTRGSLPRPGRDTLRFGGNTSCVEVNTDSGTRVIIDCGSGLYDLGHALIASRQSILKGHILISHTHWDHIQGIPFFAPFFTPGNEWDVYAPKGLGQSLQDTLAGQMQYAYFPLRLDQMGATIRYHELVEGDLHINDLKVRTQYLNHTALTLGYRLEVDGATLVYASDHEPFTRQLASGQGDILGQDRKHCEFLEGADLVIHDAQFTAQEYANKIGWGHSTVEYAVAMCRASRAARLALTHHDPLRTDGAIEEIVEDARNQCKSSPPLEIFAAAEGQELTLRAHGNALAPVINGQNKNSNGADLARSSLLLAVEDPIAASTIREAAQADDITVVEAKGENQAIANGRQFQPSLIVLEWDQDQDALQRYNKSTRDIPIIGVAPIEDEAIARAKTQVQDWLIKPFSCAYARTRIRACLLRTACHWQRALTSDEEENRLGSLYDLRILDTPPEERFDRITRLAASMLKVPIALISLVDRERQWFKSRYGLNVAETSREVSFCSHAVASQEVLVVADTLQDPRFADNPLVTGSPRIRFYAGCPVFVDEACVGTLCVLDDRPHQIDAERIRLLCELAALAETELRKSQSGWTGKNLANLSQQG